jgi:hypothetical protein
MSAPPVHPPRRGAARVLASVRGYLRRAPGTYVWLGTLAASTYVINHIDPAFHDEFLRQRSTNLHQLATKPVRVLIGSAFWLDGGGLPGYFLFYHLFHVPAERWLGTRRWLGVVVVSHVGATYLSEGALYWAIRHGRAPASSVDTLDVGVSYALAGVQAVLVYRIAPPWRYPYLAALLAWYGTGLLHGRTFTDVGHLTAALLGLACYPFTRGRGEPWNPMTLPRSLRRRGRAGK